MYDKSPGELNPWTLESTNVCIFVTWGWFDEAKLHYYDTLSILSATLVCRVLIGLWSMVLLIFVLSASASFRNSHNSQVQMVIVVSASLNYYLNLNYYFGCVAPEMILDIITSGQASDTETQQTSS